VPFAAALSEHPLAAHATGEVVGRLLEALDGPPDVAVLVVSGGHVRQFAQIAAAVRSTLAPGALVGATSIGVLAGDREVTDHASIALWAGSGVGATAVRLEPGAGPEGPTLAGLPEDPPSSASVLVLLGGAAFPIEDALAVIAERFGDLDVVGGLVSAGVRPGDDQLVCDDRIVTTGAVGVLLDPPRPVSIVVSPGCRPIGTPLVVTRAEGATIFELAGRPVLDRLDEVLLALDEHEQGVVADGLHLGRVIDEHRAEFGPGDFVMRPVIDVDRPGRSIVVAEPIEVGATVQFQVRDAAAADQDLRARLAGKAGAGALVFAGSGRGMRLSGEADRDAELISVVVDRGAAAGAFCTAVVASSGSPAVDGASSAVVVLFHDR